MTGTPALLTDAPRDEQGGGHGAHKPVFRLDIQAMRALAVVLVLLWHAGLPGLQAGYIGVDIFFVVSGYLITGLLLRERGDTGTIKIREFYARRARRLLPVAFVVTIATLIASLLIMPSLRQRSIALDGLASTLYVQNWRLAAQAVDYGASQVAASPFQHYWSLSVEEQFYVFWPLLLLVVLSGGSGFFRSGQYRSRLLTVMAVICVASFAYSMWDSYDSPDPAYFATTNRVWQFAAGGLLASVERAYGPLRRRGLAIGLAVAGLVMLIAGAIAIDPEAPYPGVSALIPTVGTAILLAGGAVAVTTAVGGWLTSRPIQRLGDLSYSLYLWHWPMLVFAQEIVGRPLSAVDGLVIVTAAIIPSLLTERLVERPIRFSRRFAPWRVGLALGAGLMVASAGIAYGLASTAPTLREADQADNPFLADSIQPETGGVQEPSAPAEPAGGSDVATGDEADDATNAPADAAATDPEPVDDGGSTSGLVDLRLGAESLLDEAGAPLPDPTVEYEYDQIFPAPGTKYIPPAFRCRSSVESESIVTDCNVAADPSRPRLALVGDSHALQWMPIVQDIAIKNDWSIDFYLKAACSLNVAQRSPSCGAWISKVQADLVENPPDFVLLSGGDPWLDSESERAALAQGYVDAWEPLRQTDAQLVVIADSPRPDKDIRECVFDNGSNLRNCAFDRGEALRSGANLEAATQPGDETIDLADLICPVDPCPAVVGQVVVFRDSNHLSQEYVRTLERPFELRLREIVEALGE